MIQETVQVKNCFLEYDLLNRNTCILIDCILITKEIIIAKKNVAFLSVHME